MYKINIISRTSNTMICSNGTRVLYYCSEDHSLKKIKDYIGNCYDENTKEWKEVQLHINKLVREEAKELLLS